MDTPERNQIATPLSKIEESPFSNFVNNLSPINPIKTLHVSQTFSSLSFTSPPSVFTSPHVSLQKESRFLRRHQPSDLAKTHFSCDEESKDSKVPGDDQQPDCLINEQVGSEGSSGSEASADPHTDVSECPTELQRILTFDTGSPDGKDATSCGIDQNCERESSRALVPFGQEPAVRGSFGAEMNAQERDHDNEEGPNDWQSLISGTTDLFLFDSPNNGATLKGPFQRSLEDESSVFASLLSQFPPEDANDIQSSHQTGPVGYNEAQQTMNQSALPSESSEMKQIDDLPENLPISSLNGYHSGDPGEKSGNEAFPNLQRGMRRRCLTFEMPRARNNMGRAIISRSSSTLQSDVSDDKQPITPRDSSRFLPLPGIGLHLNALAAASKDCRVSHQDTASPTDQEALAKLSQSSSSEKNVSPVGNENGVQIVEDPSQASAYAALEELNPNSPKKKRRKFDSVGEAEGCKRCNCKKSKCLKLYCECFAAGVYCMDSCSCQDCFNKPIHEDTVLATRKQIESRNPLAFAPKVIRGSDAAQDLTEDSTKTPASARHKRGCNCKKSNCLKKYCECYQGGVGCSIGCRCEGCKNAFGRKDGPSLLGAEAEIEEAQAPEKHIMDKRSDPPAFRSDDDLISEFTLPKTPLRIFRPSAPLLTSSKGKPPRSLATMGSSTTGLHPMDGAGRSTFLRSHSKTEKQHLKGGSGDEIPSVLQTSSPPSSGIKTLSPNGKRVSPPQSHHGNNRTSPVLRSSRKLILQSIPSFPSLTPRR